MKSGKKKPNTPDVALGGVCLSLVAEQGAALSIRDKDFKPLYANSAYLNLFDISLEVWMQGHWSAHFGPKTSKFVTDLVIPEVISGKRWHGELEIITSSGETKQVMAELNGIRDENGEITNFYALYSEVTGLKSLEKELQKQNDFLSDVIDSLPDPIVVKDEDFRWIAFNKAFRHISGRSRKELLGKTDYDYFSKEEADVFRRQDAEAMQTDDEVSNEETITSKTGETRILSTKKRSIMRQDGKKVLVGIGRDITAERQLERSIADSYRQLEVNLTALKRDLNGLQGNIASGVSRTEAIRGLIAHSNKSYADFIKGSGLEASTAPSKRDTPGHLSAREYQVFMLLAQGHRVKDAADHLGVTANTVSTYRGRIMKKLGLSSLSDMVQYALRHGLI